MARLYFDLVAELDSGPLLVLVAIPAVIAAMCMVLRSLIMLSQRLCWWPSAAKELHGAPRGEVQDHDTMHRHRASESESSAPTLEASTQYRFLSFPFLFGSRVCCVLCHWPRAMVQALLRSPNPQTRAPANQVVEEDGILPRTFGIRKCGIVFFLALTVYMYVHKAFGHCHQADLGTRIGPNSSNTSMFQQVVPVGPYLETTVTTTSTNPISIPEYWTVYKDNNRTIMPYEGRLKYHEQRYDSTDIDITTENHNKAQYATIDAAIYSLLRALRKSWQKQPRGPRNPFDKTAQEQLYEYIRKLKPMRLPAIKADSFLEDLHSKLATNYWKYKSIHLAKARARPTTKPNTDTATAREIVTKR